VRLEYMGLQPGCMRLQAGCTGLQPGCMGLQPGRTGLQPGLTPGLHRVVCVPSQPPKKSRRVPEPRATACRLRLGSPPVSPSMTTCHTLVAVSIMMTSL
jgi:hypothetical protein